MFFSFDFVIKEIVNVAALQPWSYGCSYASFVLTNLLRASTTPWLHAARLPLLIKCPDHYPGFQRISFLLSILTVRGEAASTSNRKHGLFHIRYFENGPLEPGYPTICMNDNFWIIYTFEGSVDWVYGQLGVKYSYAVSMQDRSGREERFVYVEKGLLEGGKAFR